MMHNKLIFIVVLALLLGSFCVSPAMSQDQGSQSQGYPLTGRVIDSNSKPITNMIVFFMIKRPLVDVDKFTGAVAKSTSLVKKWAKTDDAGTYAVDDIRPNDTVTIFVAKPGYRYVSGGIVGPGEIGYRASDMIVTPPTASIGGRVYDSDGKPVVGAIVIAPTANNTLQATTDPTGYFVLEGLPSGSTDLIAVSKNLYGRTSGDTGTKDVVIKIATFAKFDAQNFKKGAQIISDIYQKSTFKEYRQRESLPFEIAPYDLSAALSMSQNNGVASDDILLGLVIASTEGDPVANKATAISIINKINNISEKSIAAGLYGVAIAQRDPGTAKNILNQAKEWIKSNKFEKFGGEDTMTIAALAAKLGDPDATKIIDNVIRDMIETAKKTAEENNKKIKNSPPSNSKKNAPDTADHYIIDYLNSYVLLIAPAGSHYIEKILSQIPEQPQSPGLIGPRILPAVKAAIVLSRYDVNDAASLLKKYAGNNPSMPIFGQAVCDIVSDLAQTAPSEALSLASQVTDQDHKSVALALCQIGQPANEARWNSALDAALACPMRSPLSGWISLLTYKSDPVLGRLLFSRSETSLKKYPSVAGGLSAFMFYASEAEPDQARITIEKEFAIAKFTADSGDDADILIAPVLAMTSLDPNRALEMANSVPTPTRYVIERKIAQYIMLPQSQKSTLRFDLWMANDTWKPGSQPDK
jgi:hypothetical protein